jgi:double-strand break repair protein MRE11
MDDEIVRILVATDNHLGYLEKDAIRGTDSLAAFEEVLATAQKMKVDMVLFAGDMFHENKPSRHAMFASMELLRKYCLGEGAVYTEILSEQKDAFKSSQGVVNYENPFQAISLPVYAIHGNHDDPSRECGQNSESLAALDLLAVSNLLNYFGKAEQVDDVEINPILIRKGDTYIALYGLGAVRDERLNRMWNLRKVKFVRPSLEQGRDKYFNIFVLHQNRDYGRGSKNCIHESMIPEWMDLVIWGNEHEAVPRLVESLVGTYRIFQPGSTVATSLVEGESSTHPKGMGFLEIRSTKEFRMKSIPLKQVRPFVFREVSLSEYPATVIQPADINIEEKIRGLLSKVVDEMIATARQLSEEVELASAAAVDSNRKYVIKSPQQVLVRLRVDHSGFPTIHPQRFGALFVGKVANPNEILIFTRKKAVEGDNVKRKNRADGDDREELMHRLMDDEDNINKIKIEDLVTETLADNKKDLQLIPNCEMSKALGDFVMRRLTNAITDAVEEALEHVQRELIADVAATANLNTGNKPIVDAAARVKRTAEDAVKSGKQAYPNVVRTTRRPVVVDADSDDDDMAVDDEDKEGTGAKASRGRGRGRGGKASTAPSSSASTAVVAAAGRGSRGGRGGANARGGRGGKAAAGAGRGTKKKNASSDEEEEPSDFDVEDVIVDSDGDDEKISSKGRKGKGKTSTVKPVSVKLIPFTVRG